MLAYCSLYHDIFNICHKHCLSSEIIKKKKLTVCGNPLHHETLFDDQKK